MNKANKRFALRIYLRFPVQISLPTCQKPLVIEQATMKWAKEGLEFGIPFEHLDERGVERLQQMLNDLLASGSYRGRPMRRHTMCP